MLFAAKPESRFEGDSGHGCEHEPAVCGPEVLLELECAGVKQYACCRLSADTTGCWASLRRHKQNLEASDCRKIRCEQMNPEPALPLSASTENVKDGIAEGRAPSALGIST